MLVWATAIICAVVVFLRYAMHVSFVWMQELYVWIHAVVFMVGAGYACDATHMCGSTSSIASGLRARAR